MVDDLLVVAGVLGVLGVLRDELQEDLLVEVAPVDEHPEVLLADDHQHEPVEVDDEGEAW